MIISIALTFIGVFAIFCTTLVYTACVASSRMYKMIQDRGEVQTHSYEPTSHSTSPNRDIGTATATP